MEIKKLAKEYWPIGLNEIPQPPKELYILGEYPEEDLIYLCIVGSRKFTSYGREVCEKLIAGLKGYPIAIVSGFAIGIDTIAHKKALEVGLKTLVFPGSGLGDEAIYPKNNIKIMKEIIDKGGCFISEYEPDFKATTWSFPMRNRLMAGMSKAVLVIEAEEKSGTMITARLATEYNKDVLAIPGPIFSPNSKGTNKLLRLGATPITNTDELLEALGFETSKEEKENIQQKLFEDLSPEEKKVIEILREPKTRDELIGELNMPIQKANSLLSVMEIKNLIKEEMGEMRLK
ncbi:MAG: DNA-processing protein DprA [Candidatus Paceibacterota bacterium]